MMLVREHVEQGVENCEVRFHLELLQPSKTLEDAHLVRLDKLLDVRIVHDTVQMLLVVGFE